VKKPHTRTVKVEITPTMTISDLDEVTLVFKSSNTRSVIRLRSYQMALLCREFQLKIRANQRNQNSWWERLIELAKNEVAP
jgi:hypothetical protein